MNGCGLNQRAAVIMPPLPPSLPISLNQLNPGGQLNTQKYLKTNSLNCLSFDNRKMLAIMD